MDLCALPGCSKPVKNWRTHFCCNSHGGKYGALSLPKLPTRSDGVRIKRVENGSKHSSSLPYKDKSPEQKGKWISYLVERQKLRNKSMPPWANKKAIDAIYIEARRLTKVTGINHEVDHIIPSNHHLVCGLHVESNLQILTEFENISKSNNFIVE